MAEQQQQQTQALRPRLTVSEQLAGLVALPGAPVRAGLTRRTLTGCWNCCLLSSDLCCSVFIVIALVAGVAAFYQLFGWIGSVLVRHLSR
jgi:hypothetical protein